MPPKTPLSAAIAVAAPAGSISVPSHPSILTEGKEDFDTLASHGFKCVEGCKYRTSAQWERIIFEDQSLGLVAAAWIIKSIDYVKDPLCVHTYLQLLSSNDNIMNWRIYGEMVCFQKDQMPPGRNPGLWHPVNNAVTNMAWAAGGWGSGAPTVVKSTTMPAGMYVS